MGTIIFHEYILNKNFCRVLFPGGGQNLVTSRYFEIAKQVYQHSINVSARLTRSKTALLLLNLQATDSGQVWPVWGTCLGFEALNVITANENVLFEVDAENYSIPLQFTEGQQIDRRVAVLYLVRTFSRF